MAYGHDTIIKGMCNLHGDIFKKLQLCSFEHKQFSSKSIMVIIDLKHTWLFLFPRWNIPTRNSEYLIF